MIPQSHALDLNSEAFNLISYGPHLWRQIAGLVGVDASCDDRTTGAAGSSKLDLARHEDIGYVLVFAEEWDVEENGQRDGIGSEHADLRSVSIQGLND